MLQRGLGVSARAPQARSGAQAIARPNASSVRAVGEQGCCKAGSWPPIFQLSHLSPSLGIFACLAGGAGASAHQFHVHPPGTSSLAHPQGHAQSLSLTLAGLATGLDLVILNFFVWWKRLFLLWYLNSFFLKGRNSPGTDPGSFFPRFSQMTRRTGRKCCKIVKFIFQAEMLRKPPRDSCTEKNTDHINW
jgi:hypothetical protein